MGLALLMQGVLPCPMSCVSDWLALPLPPCEPPQASVNWSDWALAKRGISWRIFFCSGGASGLFLPADLMP